MSKEAALKVAEETIDVIEETVDTIERIPKLRLNGTTRKQQILILGFTAIAAAGASGFVVGTVVKKRMELKYEAIIEHEVAEARAFYQRLNKPSMEEVAKRHKTVDLLADDSMEEAVSALHNKYEVPETVTHNIFVEGKPMDEDFDYEAEIASRSEDKPYVISYDEFQQGEKDYIQNSLNWYEDDDVLTDDKDVIPNPDDVVGEENLQRFGHGSRDPRIVYIRNDVMEVDFEVVKNPSSYAHTVLGFQHTDRPGSRKTPRYRSGDHE